MSASRAAQRTFGELARLPAGLKLTGFVESREKGDWSDRFWFLIKFNRYIPLTLPHLTTHRSKLRVQSFLSSEKKGIENKVRSKKRFGLGVATSFWIKCQMHFWNLFFRLQRASKWFKGLPNDSDMHKYSLKEVEGQTKHQIYSQKPSVALSKAVLPFSLSRPSEPNALFLLLPRTIPNHLWYIKSWFWGI